MTAAEDCHLCGEPIAADDKASDDHAVPKHLRRHKQPKVKGFDYARPLRTHESCNNAFGPERINQKALTLIRVLHDDRALRVLVPYLIAGCGKITPPNSR